MPSSRNEAIQVRLIEVDGADEVVIIKNGQNTARHREIKVEELP
jgi:hypothetical protein